MGLGSVTACEKVVSAAMATPVAEAREVVTQASVANVDETGWKQKNAPAWLWSLRTALLTVFMIHASRGREAAKELLGRFAGVLVSDRWHAYNCYTGVRQWCWSHLKRDFTAFGEHPGKAGRIGRRLVKKTDLLFHWWHRVRDGTLKRKTFQRRMKPMRAQMEALLRQGTTCGQANVERACKRILKGAPHLWTFVDVGGVEPTNNGAERAVRPGVLWRRISFGTQSETGSRFAERILTVAATCRQQGRNTVDFVKEAVVAHFHNHPAPSLLPVSEGSFVRLT
jgi:transposase